MLRSLLLIAVPTLALVPANAAPPGKSKATLERDAFFKNGKVVTLELVFDKKEADSLRREPRKYAKATLKEGDKTYRECRRTLERRRRELARHSTTSPASPSTWTSSRTTSSSTAWISFTSPIRCRIPVT